MIDVPRESAPGPYYGHPLVYIGPRGVPLGRSWAVYVADGGAWDRHTVRTIVETEAEAETIAAGLIKRGACAAVASQRRPIRGHSGIFRPAFGALSGGPNPRNPLQHGD